MYVHIHILFEESASFSTLDLRDIYLPFDHWKRRIFRVFQRHCRVLCKSTALCWMISAFRFYRSHLLDFLRRERGHMWHLTASVTSFTCTGSVPGELATSRANFFARSLMEFVRRWMSRRAHPDSRESQKFAGVMRDERLLEGIKYLDRAANCVTPAS